MSSGVEGAGPRAQKNPRGRISSEAHTSRKKQSRFPAWAKHPAFQIAVGAIGGVIFGLIVGDWAANLDFVGKIFIRLIQMSIVPLVLASVITATGSMSGSVLHTITSEPNALMTASSPAQMETSGACNGTPNWN